MIKTLIKALHVAMKDVRLYFFKGPNITFGLFLPVIIYVAFSIGRVTEISFTLPGLVAMSSLFGAGAIQSVALPLERSTGTFNRLLAAPISMKAIVFGKTLAGFFFGFIISMTYSLFIVPIVGPARVNPAVLVLGLVLPSLVFSSMGLAMAAPFRDIPQAMPPATLVRVLMVFLSGVFIPVSSMPVPLKIVVHLHPLAYAVDLLQQAMAGPAMSPLMLLLDVVVLAGFTVAFIMITVVILERTTK